MVQVSFTHYFVCARTRVGNNPTCSTLDKISESIQILYTAHNQAFFTDKLAWSMNVRSIRRSMQYVFRVRSESMCSALMDALEYPSPDHAWKSERHKSLRCRSLMVQIKVQVSDCKHDIMPKTWLQTLRSTKIPTARIRWPLMICVSHHNKSSMTCSYHKTIKPAHQTTTNCLCPGTHWKIIQQIHCSRLITWNRLGTTNQGLIVCFKGIALVIWFQIKNSANE